MSKFTIEITDEAKLAGITSAREAYNEVNPNDPIETDEGYTQFVMDSAAESYANQHG